LLAEGSLLLAVKVTPRCSKSEVTATTPEGVLKARLAAIPEKGKANEELRRLLSDFFAVPKSGVEILLGKSSPHKRVRITR
jgi:uncharacterized protein (TIGR00251 family)